MRIRKHIWFASLALVATAAIALNTANVPQIDPQDCQQLVPSIETAFSPKQGATKLIIKNIQAATKSIQIAAYSFTSKPITWALINAHKRGVIVQIVLDKSQAKDRNSMYQTFLYNGIPTRINYRYAIMHNKFMIIDAETLQLGSFNYSHNAENKNAENVMVISNAPSIIQQYSDQWQTLWNEAS